jgi:hypothetical protein
MLAIGGYVRCTRSWLTELLLRRVLRRDLPRFRPIMFRAGLGLSLLLTFVPPVSDGLKWAFLAARANHVE